MTTSRAVLALEVVGVGRIGRRLGSKPCPSSSTWMRNEVTPQLDVHAPHAIGIFAVP